MIANTITLCRLLLTFVVIVLFGTHHTLDMGLVATIAIIFALDGIDGYIARRRNETSKLGEVLDTVADRIIENTFWIYFTTTGHLPLWMPIVVMARGFITDALQRSLGYPESGWTHALTHQPRPFRDHQNVSLYESCKHQFLENPRLGTRKSHTCHHCRWVLSPPWVAIPFH